MNQSNPTKEGHMKKSFLAVSVLAVALLLFSGGASAAKPKSVKKEVVQSGPITRQFIQTSPLLNSISATITVIGDQSEEGRIQTIVGQILSDLNRIDSTINSPDEGELSKINRLGKGDKITLSDEMFALVSKARDLAVLTKGQYNFTSDYKRVSLNSENKTLAFKGSDMKIDLSGVWSAFLVDTAMNKLTAEGLTNAKVEIGNVNRNVGRDIYTPWNVSVNIPDPKSANAYRAYVYSFSNKAAATMTPQAAATGLAESENEKTAPNGFTNVTVFGGDSMTASAFALALYSMGPKSAPAFVQKHPEVKSIFVGDDGKVSTSSNFEIGRPNYNAESEPVIQAKDRGSNDLRQKQKEEAKD